MKNYTIVGPVTFTIILLLFARSSTAAETLKWTQKPKLTFDKKEKKWTVTFELDSLTDVEVAIVDPENTTVVRHLAAGVLGPKAPPPLTVNSRAQMIEWDGKDDYGKRLVGQRHFVIRFRCNPWVDHALCRLGCLLGCMI